MTPSIMRLIMMLLRIPTFSIIVGKLLNKQCIPKHFDTQNNETEHRDFFRTITLNITVRKILY